MADDGESKDPAFVFRYPLPRRRPRCRTERSLCAEADDETEGPASMLSPCIRARLQSCKKNPYRERQNAATTQTGCPVPASLRRENNGGSVGLQPHEYPPTHSREIKYAAKPRSNLDPNPLIRSQDPCRHISTYRVALPKTLFFGKTTASASIPYDLGNGSTALDNATVAAHFRISTY